MGHLFNFKKENLSRPVKSFDQLKDLDLTLSDQEWKIQNGKDNYFFNVSQKSITLHSFDVGRIFLFREITALKIAEEKLSHNLEFKARLLSMIAHDFSGVLKAQSFLASSLEQEASMDQKSKATTLVDSTFASKDFMANVLIWARTQENRFEPLIRPFELNTLINDVVHALEGVWKIRDLQLIVTTNRNPVLMSGDSVMIESVVRNLLANAVQASSIGQTIEIHIQDTRVGHVKILIRDHGIGMSSKQLKVIQTSSDYAFVMDEEMRPNGFGIGLAIAKRFTEIHKGQIEFSTTEGEGTLVALTLPT